MPVSPFAKGMNSMAERLDDSAALESTTVGVFRTAATVKGGRRFSFSSMVVVGDRNGSVGFGYGKANQVPPAIEKAQKEARRRMKRYPLQGRTLPHAVTGRFGACSVLLLPASPGTGVIAGAPVRAPLEMLGIQDCLTKSYGSNNSKNLVKAVFDGLNKLQSKGRIEQLRGMDLGKTMVEDAIERGNAFAGAVAPDDKQANGESAAPKPKTRRTDAPKQKPRKPAPQEQASPAPAPAESAPAESAPAAPAAETSPQSESTPDN